MVHLVNGRSKNGRKSQHSGAEQGSFVNVAEFEEILKVCGIKDTQPIIMQICQPGRRDVIFKSQIMKFLKEAREAQSQFNKATKI